MSTMDLLKDLVGDSAWKHLYDQEVNRGNQLFDKLSNAECKLILCQHQRASLVARVRMLAILLEPTHPNMAKLVRDQLDILETDYARPIPPLGSSRRAQTPAPSGSPDQAGSGAVSETAKELESAQGVSVSHSAAGIPPVIVYCGDWDSVTAPTSGVKP
jgi:hypothetical protein